MRKRWQGEYILRGLYRRVRFLAMDWLNTFGRDEAEVNSYLRSQIDEDASQLVRAGEREDVDRNGAEAPITTFTFSSKKYYEVAAKNAGHVDTSQASLSSTKRRPLHEPHPHRLQHSEGSERRKPQGLPSDVPAFVTTFHVPDPITTKLHAARDLGLEKEPYMDPWDKERLDREAEKDTGKPGFRTAFHRTTKVDEMLHAARYQTLSQEPYEAEKLPERWGPPPAGKNPFVLAYRTAAKGAQMGTHQPFEYLPPTGSHVLQEAESEDRRLARRCRELGWESEPSFVATFRPMKTSDRRCMGEQIE